ncbi:hypothetical protein [Ammoniphilus resinae]|uniref:N-acetyltransferase domain-containing protein n=1 Tax=Ammoniphilus resinae TaxID=861532 RepID=A0ABS4GIV7_9BACL|nr:hypothetical protein [Ammoniphilus resinae]MBP1930189.1 hypothetical protein [Ammoniphilus resinae]
MNIQLKECTTDDDFAKTGIFFLEHRLDFRRDFNTIDAVTALHGYIVNGHLIQILDASGNLIGMSGYYYGTPEKEFEDRHIVLIDAVILALEKRKTTAFVRGFQQLVDRISQEASDTLFFQFNASVDNHYLQKLYSKFAEPIYTEDDIHRFSVKIDHLTAFLERFSI